MTVNQAGTSDGIRRVLVDGGAQQDTINVLSTASDGVVSVLLGIFIWRRWPWAGLWVIGLFVGIELMLNGVQWLMLGLAARNLPRESKP